MGYFARDSIACERTNRNGETGETEREFWCGLLFVPALVVGSCLCVWKDGHVPGPTDLNMCLPDPTLPLSIDTPAGERFRGRTTQLPNMTRCDTALRHTRSLRLLLHGGEFPLQVLRPGLSLVPRRTLFVAVTLRNPRASCRQL